MSIESLSAANAYKNQLKMQQNIEDSLSGGEPKGASFEKLVQDGLQSAIDSQYKAEALKTEALTGGKVDITDLVTAISSAELTLSTVISIRDKVISAYQDIIRMPI